MIDAVNEVLDRSSQQDAIAIIYTTFPNSVLARMVSMLCNSFPEAQRESISPDVLAGIIKGTYTLLRQYGTRVVNALRNISAALKA